MFTKENTEAFIIVRFIIWLYFQHLTHGNQELEKESQATNSVYTFPQSKRASSTSPLDKATSAADRIFPTDIVPSLFAKHHKHIKGWQNKTMTTYHKKPSVKIGKQQQK